jgi:hypothetical protein
LVRANGISTGLEPGRGDGDNRATMTDATLIATRESRLALWQAEHVRALLSGTSACVWACWA